MEKKSKCFNLITIFLSLGVLAVLGGLTFYIDPVFHYRAPRENYAYPLDNERYQNDGITRNFSYDTIITGSSMTANFKTSECDELLGGTSVKVPFSGGGYKEVNDNLERAFQTHPNIKRVIRSLDYSFMVKDKDQVVENVNYPEYLTNDNVLDDVNYVWNKEVLIGMTKSVFNLTESGGMTTTLDDYDNWMEGQVFGKEAVLATYVSQTEADVKQEENIAQNSDTESASGIAKESGTDEAQKTSTVNTAASVTKREFTDEEKETVRENINQNILALVKEHPETEFDLFLTPYSVCYWDVLSMSGEIEWQLEVEQFVIDMLLPYENVHLYGFGTNAELVSDLDNYKDQAHYGEWVNSDILRWISEDQYRITEKNKENYEKQMHDYYTTYDYASLHEG